MLHHERRRANIRSIRYSRALGSDAQKARRDFPSESLEITHVFTPRGERASLYGTGVERATVLLLLNMTEIKPDSRPAAPQLLARFLACYR